MFAFKLLFVFTAFAILMSAAQSSNPINDVYNRLKEEAILKSIASGPAYNYMPIIIRGPLHNITSMVSEMDTTP